MLKLENGAPVGSEITDLNYIKTDFGLGLDDGDLIDYDSLTGWFLSYQTFACDNGEAEAIWYPILRDLSEWARGLISSSDV